MGPSRSSKKRPQANRAHCRVKEISLGRDGAQAPFGYRSAMSLSLSNSSACGLFLAPGYQAHDYRDDNQHRDRDSDIEWCDQARFFGSRRGRGRWGRRILRRQPTLGKLQSLESIIVLRIKLQRGLIIGDRLLVLPHQAIGVTALGQGLYIVWVFLQ